MLKKVFCWGTFDILHRGHMDFLQDAKSKGDLLSVIVVPDSAVIENKGHAPEHTQQQRIQAIRNTGLADDIIGAQDLETNLRFLLESKPDVFVFGYDQDTSAEKRLKEYFAENGLSVEYYISKKFADGLHSSSIKRML